MITTNSGSECACEACRVIVVASGYFADIKGSSAYIIAVRGDDGLYHMQSSPMSRTDALHEAKVRRGR